MTRVITFGEILLRLAPPGYQRLFQGNSLEATFCGAEANVAVALANFGLEAVFVSKVPDSAVGRAAINALRYFGVDTSMVQKGGERLGLYYLEKGAGQRPARVLYDRVFSAIAAAEKSDFDWDTIFKGAGWFHFSGITPALSDSLAEICLEACKKAKNQGIAVSCDLNYRSTLWQPEATREKMSKLLPYVDLCIGSEEDPEKMLGIKPENSDINSGLLNREAYGATATEISRRFDCRYVAITLRTSISASYNKWAGLLYTADKNEHYFSKEYAVQVIDRVGSGESFAAGLIYGLTKKIPYQDCVEFAAAAGCLKHTLEGDFSRFSVEEVLALLAGDASGRVKR